jgi:hypothetical protein
MRALPGSSRWNYILLVDLVKAKKGFGCVEHISGCRLKWNSICRLRFGVST